MNELQYQPNTSLETQDERQTGMLLHLSQLINLIIPLGGTIAPIIFWQVKKDEMPAIDAHGKMVTNWLISSFVYIVISFILMFVIIGFFTFLAVAIMGVVFPIIGGVKANNGELWEYPLTIKFLK